MFYGVNMNAWYRWRYQGGYRRYKERDALVKRGLASWISPFPLVTIDKIVI